jgi:hypothetical protein
MDKGRMIVISNQALLIISKENITSSLINDALDFVKYFSEDNNMNYSIKLLVGITLILVVSITFAQKQPEINDKPGTFEILSRTNYTMSDCGFTKAEMTANLQKITELINTFRHFVQRIRAKPLESARRIEFRYRMQLLPCIRLSPDTVHTQLSCIITGFRCELPQ